MMLTNNPILIRAAEKNYCLFKVPVCAVDSSKTQRYYSKNQMADLDDKTSDNKIGEIINLSQQLNSLMWENIIGKHQTIEENKELYMNICKLAVLSGVEIDRAKKEFLLNTGLELKLLKDKYAIIKDGRIIKPMFFRMITLENGYQLSDKHEYTYFNTPMDYLSEEVTKFHRSVREHRDYITLVDIMTEDSTTTRGSSWVQKKDTIINKLKEIRTAQKAMFLNIGELTKEERASLFAQQEEEQVQAMQEITDLKINENVARLLLKASILEENKDIKNTLFLLLCNLPNNLFLTILKDNEEKYSLKESSEITELRLYDYYYNKEKVTR